MIENKDDREKLEDILCLIMGCSNLSASVAGLNAQSENRKKACKLSRELLNIDEEEADLIYDLWELKR